ncbi:hypothetical protein RISW2_07505 [Roseivivax isoporae LMG 25204]|uniref:Uncharacterized protein n=1 Tax=Roseivivax isoporae LMG 25204 TaxID=1449351 RepID=X7FD97_9RHOB|nr:hypothetical protein RISW2_07505 [Roseivivax isoporae LMG 25204]
MKWQSSMKLLTLIQAAALVVLTVLGAYAASETSVETAADPACVTLSHDGCTR